MALAFSFRNHIFIRFIVRNCILLPLFIVAISASALGAQTWQLVGHAPAGELRFISKTRGWIGDNRTTDGGLTWSLDSMAPLGSFPFFGTLYTVYPSPPRPTAKDSTRFQRYYSSSDSGISWQRLGSRFERSGYAVKFLFTSSMHGIVIEESATGDPYYVDVISSNDGGISWPHAYSLVQGADVLVGASISFKNDASGIASELSETMPRENIAKIFNTSDGGITWSVTRTIDSAAVLPTFAWLHDDVWLSSDGFRSLDNGNTWSRASAFVAQRFARSNDHLVLAVSNGQLFHSTDDGSTWRPQFVRSGTFSIVGMSFPTPELGYLLYGDSTLWRTEVGGADAVTELPKLSTSFADVHLSQNPFSNSTNLSFDLSRSSQVRCEIFDVVGRSKFATAMRGSVGQNQLPLGTQLTKGAYFLRLSNSEGEVASVKLTKE